VGLQTVSEQRPLQYWPPRPAFPLSLSLPRTRGTWPPFACCAPPLRSTQQLQGFITPSPRYSASKRRTPTDPFVRNSSPTSCASIGAPHSHTLRYGRTCPSMP